MSSPQNKTLLSIWRTFFVEMSINLAYGIAYQSGVFIEQLPINLAYGIAYQFGVFIEQLPINLAYGIAYQFGVWNFYIFTYGL